jgi:hypothetical protein
MAGTGPVKSEDDDEMRESGDILEAGGISGFDFDLAPDVGVAVWPAIPARVDVLPCFERRMDGADRAESNQSLTRVSHFS